MSKLAEICVLITRPCSGHTVLEGFIRSEEFAEDLYEKYSGVETYSAILASLLRYVRSLESDSVHPDEPWDQLQIWPAVDPKGLYSEDG